MEGMDYGGGGGGALVAQIVFTTGGQPRKIELFGDYVLRQLGVCRDANAMAARLADVAMSYLEGGGDTSSLADMLTFFSRIEDDDRDVTGGSDADVAAGDAEMAALQAALVDELEACMISYFAFHWHHSETLMGQVGRRGERSLLKSIVSAATREGRVKRVMQTLKMKRAFVTLVEEIKTLGTPGDRSQSHPCWGDRSPVLLLIGGGMGAGKSTVVTDILRSSFWGEAAGGAVVVEADAFKEADVVYQAMAAMGDAGIASQVVHQFSTDAAASLLVAALNSGRDVIFDGTMSWAPFVRQTIAMARDVHRRRYRMGIGYQRFSDGTVIEDYWKPDDEEHPPQGIRPYRIELVGVICHPLLAVVRGIRRGIVTKRSVPIQGQLRSHKLFAEGIDEYSSLVDQARIYSSDSAPRLIASKDGTFGEFVVVDTPAFSLVRRVAELEPNAGSFLELFDESAGCCGPWKQVVLSGDRQHRQEHLRKLMSGHIDFRSFSMNKMSQGVESGPHMPHSASLPML